MPATDKPMLTKEQVKEFVRWPHAPTCHRNMTEDEKQAALNTLAAAIELLERWAESQTPWFETQNMLATYHSTTAASNASKGDV